MTGIGTFVPSPWSVAGRALHLPVPSAPPPLPPPPLHLSPPPLHRAAFTAPQTTAGDAVRSVVVAVWHRRVAVAIVSLCVAAPWYPVTGSWRVALAVLGVSVCLLAAAVPVVGVVRGRLSEFDPAGQIMRRLQIPAATIRPDDPRLALALLGVMSGLVGHRALTVVQLGSPDECDVAVDLDAAAGMLGEGRTLHDLTPGSRPAPNHGSRPGSATLHSLRTPSLTASDVQLLRATPRPSILVIDTARATWARLERARQILDALGCDVAAVVVWSGRLPHDPSESWDPVRVSL